MAATVRIIEKNGSSGVATEKSNGSTVRFKNADNASVDLANPLVKPVSGLDFSYQKYLRLEITGGTFQEISNLKFYTDGANNLGSGVNIYAKAEAVYSQPVEPSDTSGYSNVFVHTAAAPLSLGAGPFSDLGEIGNHVVLFMTVDSTTPGGSTASEVFTFVWDEI